MLAMQRNAATCNMTMSKVSAPSNTLCVLLLKYSGNALYLSSTTFIVVCNQNIAVNLLTKCYNIYFSAISKYIQHLLRGLHYNTQQNLIDFCPFRTKCIECNHAQNKVKCILG